MTKDESLKISAEIASMINSGDLVIDYSESEIKGMKLGISEVSLEGYRHAGLLGDCDADENEFEKFSHGPPVKKKRSRQKIRRQFVTSY